MPSILTARASRLTDGKCIVGCYLFSQPDEVHPEGAHFIRTIGCDVYQVDPDTVELKLGKPGKDGVELFQGDDVVMQNDYHSFKLYGTIMFDGAGFYIHTTQLVFLPTATEDDRYIFEDYTFEEADGSNYRWSTIALASSEVDQG